MDETFLYQKIAEATRRDILEGRLKPGDRLPSVRQLCEQWNCTPGTIQRAYHELAQEGLLVSRAGQGTQVASRISEGKMQGQSTLRRAGLVNRAEGFLLEALTAGYDLNEIQQAVDMAMDRWRVFNLDTVSGQAETDGGILHFFGSHDMLLNDIAHFYFGQNLDTALEIAYTGSLGGLMALAAGKADLTGCHLWDAETDSYNLPFVRRLFPGKAIKVFTLAHRRIGLILAPGNPLNISSLENLTSPSIHFINRQAGSGTRVWLDAQLALLKILPSQIIGYDDEGTTHSAIARAVAEGKADAGLGLESAAQAYGLSFVFLNRERYDLVMTAETANLPIIRQWIAWLGSEEGKAFIDHRPGYDSLESGKAVL